MAESWRVMFVDKVSEGNRLERVTLESLKDTLDHYKIPADEIEHRLFYGSSGSWYEGKDKTNHHSDWRQQARDQAMLMMVETAALEGCILLASFRDQVSFTYTLIDFSHNFFYGADCTATGIIPKDQNTGDG